MKWRYTLILLAVCLAGAFLIWRAEFVGDRSADTQRRAEGYLYPWDLTGLRAIELVYPERSFRLEKRDETWGLSSPMRETLDEGALSKLLSTLEAQEVERWLPPRPRADWDELGLAEPRLEVRLLRGGRSDTLRFGRLNEVEKRLWLAVSWSDSLALVSTLLRSNLMLGYYELLSKKVIHDLPPSELESLELGNARGAFELRRCDWGWEIRRPEPYLCDGGRVRDLFGQLFGETIIDFVQEPSVEAHIYGFAAPRATIRLKLKGEERLRLLELGGGMHDLHYARYLDRDQVYLLRSQAGELLMESFSNYMSVVLVSFINGQALELDDTVGRRAIRDMSQDWEWSDQDGRKLPDTALVALLSRLSRLSTERVAALLPRSDQLALWGLDPPSQIFRLSLKDDLDVTIEVGDEHDGRRYFQRGDYPTVYSLPAEEVDLRWPEPL